MNKWDSYFIEIARIVSTRSHCLSRQIGAVVVRDQKFIVSTGYNGPPMGVGHCGDERFRSNLFGGKTKDRGETYSLIMERMDVCPRKIMGYESSEGLHWCPAAHAEKNAIDISARLGHQLEGCKMYLYGPTPCLECAKSIINAGIVEVISTGSIYDVHRFSEGISGIELFSKSKVNLREFKLDD